MSFSPIVIGQTPIPTTDITPPSLPPSLATNNGASSTVQEQQAATATTKKLTFLGWGVLLLGLYALNGTSLGHEAIYYSLVLIVLFLFIYNYQAILKVLTK